MNSSAAAPVPFPSPPAADPISRLQLLLTNYSNHLYEVVQQVPEAAAPLLLSTAAEGADDDSAASAFGEAASAAADTEEEKSKTREKEERQQQQQRFQSWLTQSAENLATIMQAIETEAEKLPSSNRKIEDIYARLAELERQNSAAAGELAAAAAAAGQLHRLLRMQTRAALAGEGLKGCVAVEYEEE